jgi:Tfp pilus assembly protein PilW
MNILHVSRKKGFTLVEILLALFICMLLLATVYFAVTTGQKSSRGVEIKVAAQQDVRAILETMALEIEMASYNPTFQPSFWRNPGDCTALATNQANRGIQLATPTSLSVQMDLDGNSQIFQVGSTADLNEIITYDYDMDNQRITRQVNCADVASFLGDLAGSVRSVRVVNDVNQNKGYDEAVDIPVFRYFDVNGTEIPAANLSANISLIRRIEINLSVETDEIDPSTRTRRRMNYTTSVVPRNHGYR